MDPALRPRRRETPHRSAKEPVPMITFSPWSPLFAGLAAPLLVWLLDA
jgi:hypothetical protein